MAKHPLTALAPYLCYELGTDERIRVRRHLEACAQCREFKESLADASADFARWIEQMPTPDLLIYREQLARKLAARQPAERRLWRPRFAWVSLAAAGVSTIALIAMFGTHRQPSVPSVEQLATENQISDAGIGLLRNYPVITHLELLENYDVIEHLNELPEADDQHHATRA